MPPMGMAPAGPIEGSILTVRRSADLPASGTLTLHAGRIGAWQKPDYRKAEMTTHRGPTIRTVSSGPAKVAKQAGLADRVSDAIMNLISSVPSSSETNSTTPGARAKLLARNTAMTSAGISGGAAPARCHRERGCTVSRAPGHFADDAQSGVKDWCQRWGTHLWQGNRPICPCGGGRRRRSVRLLRHQEGRRNSYRIVQQ